MVISYNLTEKSSIISFAINLMQVNVNTCTIPAFFFLIIVKYIEYDIYEHISVRYILFNSMSWLSSPIFILCFSPKSLPYLVAALFMHIDLTSQKSIAKKNNAFYYNYYFRVGKVFLDPLSAPDWIWKLNW